VSALGDGALAALIIVLIALVFHEPWRWLGLYIGRGLDVEGEVFEWVRAVATALVAGLVTRLVLFPAGALAGVPLWVRLAAFAGAVALYFLARRNLLVGVLGGSLILIGGALVSP
jgi:hypothetical protein